MTKYKHALAVVAISLGISIPVQVVLVHYIKTDLTLRRPSRRIKDILSITDEYGEENS